MKGSKRWSTIFLGEARPAVADGDLDALLLEQGRGQHELAPLARRHRLERVADQIDEYLLDLNSIGERLRGLRVEAETHIDAVRSRAGQREGGRLLDERNHAFDPSLRRAAAGEITQPADDLSGAQLLPDRLLHVLPGNLDRMRIAPRQAASRRIDKNWSPRSEAD